MRLRARALTTILMLAAGVPALAQLAPDAAPIDATIAAEQALAPSEQTPAASPPAPAATKRATESSRDRIFYPGDTERWRPLVTKLLGNTLLDQKEIWTSPFHMRARDAKWWIGGAAITAALIATDHRTSTVFENSRGQVSWGNGISKMGASYTLLPVVAGVLIALNPNENLFRSVGIGAGCVATMLFLFFGSKRVEKQRLNQEIERCRLAFRSK